MIHVRLSRCGCEPAAYSGGSTSLVHGATCETPEKGLSDAEYREYRAKVRAEVAEHPTAARFSAVARVVPWPVPKDRWHTCGFNCGCEASLRGDGIRLVGHRRV